MMVKENLATPPGSAILGESIPATPHALSVSLPTWQDNVYWAEGDARVVDKMATGYPRFFVHRSIQKLARLVLELLDNRGDMAMLFPTVRTSNECLRHIKKHAPEDQDTSGIAVVHFELKPSEDVHEDIYGLHAVLFPPELWKIAKSFWQNAGMGISSRYAESILEEIQKGDPLRVIEEPQTSFLNEYPKALEQKRDIKRRIANLINGGNGSEPTIQEPTGGTSLVTEKDIYLYPTGMSGIWHAHQLSLEFKPDQKCICFGFSYTDTIKVLERWGPGSVTFFNDPDSNLEALDSFLSTESVAALFCEVPSNPLLQTPNLPRLRALADKYNFLIVVDETVGNFVNVDVLQFADIAATSMSKLFSGSANVMGGSLVLNPNSKNYNYMQAYQKQHFVDDYYHEDAIVMDNNSVDFASRVRTINSNTVTLCEYLRNCSLSFAGPNSKNPDPEHERFVIKDVFFPKWVSRENYDHCRRKNTENNFGPLFSLTFVSKTASHAFYDALKCAKGPSLGTNFTLACPYTILAHYNERPWAASYGVEEGIVRLSVGMEDPETLLGWIKYALEEAERTR